MTRKPVLDLSTDDVIIQWTNDILQPDLQLSESQKNWTKILSFCGRFLRIPRPKSNFLDKDSFREIKFIFKEPSQETSASYAACNPFSVLMNIMNNGSVDVDTIEQFQFRASSDAGFLERCNMPDSPPSRQASTLNLERTPHHPSFFQHPLEQHTNVFLDRHLPRAAILGKRYPDDLPLPPLRRSALTI